MKQYPKINMLHPRDSNGRVMYDKYSDATLEVVDSYIVTEKIDGTNIRVMMDEHGDVTFGGKTNKAVLQDGIEEHLEEKFTTESMGYLSRSSVAPNAVTLYGECCGPGIQKHGEKYRDEKTFVLFDVLVNNRHWLDEHDVTDVAEQLEIPRVPIICSQMTKDEIRKHVQYGFTSTFATHERPGEGVVAKSTPQLYDKRLNRVMFKLRTSDYADLMP